MYYEISFKQNTCLLVNVDVALLRSKNICSQKIQQLFILFGYDITIFNSQRKTFKVTTVSNNKRPKKKKNKKKKKI